ncbi:hydroxyacid dehydrogenase [Patescibacteria group bacterium]|nr:hydroxyacid dehydrogenase [Patescibacteria group bacterium]
MKIAFFELGEWAKPLVQEALSAHELSFSEEALDESHVPGDANVEIISVFVGSSLSKKVLDQFPKLKLVAVRSMGFDHIDIEACRERGILVSRVPAYGENTVAEYTWGLILSLTRKIYQAVDRIKETGEFTFKGLRGTDVEGKTLGIVGLGKIGKRVARIAKGFEMRLIGTDPHPDAEFAKETGLTYVELEELLSTSDIITLHAPLLDSTRHLLNKKNMRTIKHGAYLVNTARGGLVETEALCEQLLSGQLAGVALDVLEEEGDLKEELELLSRPDASAQDFRVLLENHRLIRMPNVLITPHNAFNSQEALECIVETTLRNIQGFVEGKPINLVS